MTSSIRLKSILSYALGGWLKVWFWSCRIRCIVVLWKVIAVVVGGAIESLAEMQGLWAHNGPVLPSALCLYCFWECKGKTGPTVEVLIKREHEQMSADWLYSRWLSLPSSIAALLIRVFPDAPLRLLIWRYFWPCGTKCFFIVLLLDCHITPFFLTFFPLWVFEALYTSGPSIFPVIASLTLPWNICLIYTCPSTRLRRGQQSPFFDVEWWGNGDPAGRRCDYIVWFWLRKFLLFRRHG